MFNEMSSKPLNDSGIDHGNKKNPKASHLMGIDRDDHSTDTVRNTKWGINKSTVYKMLLIKCCLYYFQNPSSKRIEEEKKA